MVSKARKRVGELGLAPALAHRRAQHLLDLQALGHQHRRLVREADALQVALGIEAGARRLAEALDQRPRPDRAADEVADELAPPAGP